MILFNCFALNFFGAHYHNKIKSSMEMLPAADYKKCMIQRSPQDRIGDEIGELKGEYDAYYCWLTLASRK